MLDFFKRAGGQLVAAICAVQAFAWLFGFFDELTQPLREHRELTALGVILYFGLYYITYDATYRAQKMRYKKRLRGASLRLPVNKKPGAGVVRPAKRPRKGA